MTPRPRFLISSLCIEMHRSLRSWFKLADETSADGSNLRAMPVGSTAVGRSHASAFEDKPPSLNDLCFMMGHLVPVI